LGSASDEEERATWLGYPC